MPWVIGHLDFLLSRAQRQFKLGGIPLFYLVYRTTDILSNHAKIAAHGSPVGLFGC